MLSLSPLSPFPHSPPATSPPPTPQFFKKSFPFPLPFQPTTSTSLPTSFSFFSPSSHGKSSYNSPPPPNNQRKLSLFIFFFSHQISSPFQKREETRQGRTEQNRKNLPHRKLPESVNCNSDIRRYPPRPACPLPKSRIGPRRGKGMCREGEMGGR